MNWKKILEAYIAHVGECEGITFLENNEVLEGLSLEENQALLDLYRELWQQWNPGYTFGEPNRPANCLPPYSLYDTRTGEVHSP